MNQTFAPDHVSQMPQPKIHEGWLLFVLAAIQFTHVMDFVIMMPLGPQLMRYFTIGPREFGFLVSAYTFSAAISGFISAFFIDRFGRKQAMLVLYVGFLLGTLACALAPTFGLLLLARVVAGLFGGVLGALILAVIGDVIPEERRGTATGKVMAAFSFASIAGIPLGLYLASVFSWHAPFFLLTGLSVLVLLLIARFLPTMNDHLNKKVRTRPVEIYWAIFSKPNLLWALLLMVVLSFAGYTIIPFISPYMVANIGFSEVELSYIYFFGGLASLITSPLAGKLADMYGKKRVFVIGSLLSLIPIILITQLQPSPHYIVLLITTFFFISFGARYVPAMSLITSSVEPQQRGSFMSVNSAIQQLASGAAAFIAGFIVQKGVTGQLEHFDTAGYVAAVSTIISMLIVVRLRKVS
ncbi:MFS transporter [soil metagenome]|jgi:predicted MFS family arabinose efflux permease